MNSTSPFTDLIHSQQRQWRRMRLAMDVIDAALTLAVFVAVWAIGEFL